MSNRIDKIKLNHWLNIRKTTIEILNKLLGNSLNYKLSLENLENLDEHSIEKIAKVLSISKINIIETESTPSFIFNTKDQIKKTKRPIKRGGIHYYNYYTLPSPKGYVAPVLIDILCPKDKMPVLNNGHLEPAITVSLGPNDIYARFAKKINKHSMVKFRINPDPKTDWIVGSNYYEPSYCLHTYSRATSGPGKILSYTTKSNIENLFGSRLNENSFNSLKDTLNLQNPNRSFLYQDILNKGFSLDYISKKTKINKKKLENYFKRKNKSLSNKEITKICKITNSNPNDYFDRSFKEDPVGKHYFDYKDSIKTIRDFKSYKVASIACSPRSPDLTGYFIKVENKTIKTVTDILDSTCAHYLVSKGNLNCFILINGKLKKIKMQEGDSIWMGSYTKHGFTGLGALVKISDGQNFNYLEKTDLINTYNLKMTLARGRKDNINWGYDTK
jgi:hypothetical protein